MQSPTLTSSLINSLKIFLLSVLILVFICISTVIHEYGHALAAIVLGASPSEIDIYLIALPPHIVVPDNAFPEPYLVWFHLAGGLAAGIILTVSYILIMRLLSRKSGFKPFHVFSLIGLACILVGIFEIYQAFWEGFDFSAYRTGEHFTFPWVAMPLLAALIIHFMLTPIRKHLVSKG